MNVPDLQYRNNDPSENVQVEFTDLAGRRCVISFVATRPHWCEEPDIYGDLFNVPLEKVFEGEAMPVARGSAEEGALIKAFREFVHSVVQNPEFYRKKAHISLRTDDQVNSLHLVWLLDALEKRREQAIQ